MDTLIQLTLPTMDTLRDCLIHIYINMKAVGKQK